MEIQIAVCGAGTMGSGIAMVFAQHDFSVTLFDISEEGLSNARAVIQKNLNYLLQKNKISVKGRDEIFSRIKFTTDIRDCTAYIIIEAIAERLDAKIDLFNKLSAFNNEEVIFATNTSSLSVTEIQRQVPFPQRVAGMHFFNPPYIMPLVEVIRGEQTRDQIIASLKEICIALGKKPVVCLDSPGFIVNRVARPYYLESLRLLEQGAATAEEIDAILEATGFKMGPFRLMDMIGMDINLATSESVYESLGRPERLRPSPIQKHLVEQGELGRKTGKGFYQY